MEFVQFIASFLVEQIQHQKLHIIHIMIQCRNVEELIRYFICLLKIWINVQETCQHYQLDNYLERERLMMIISDKK
jgi:hypothetical protein